MVFRIVFDLFRTQYGKSTLSGTHLRAEKPHFWDPERKWLFLRLALETAIFPTASQSNFRRRTAGESRKGRQAEENAVGRAVIHGFLVPYLT